MKKYLVDETELTQEEFEQRLEDEVRNQCDDDSYDEFINESADEINIWGMHYSPSEVLKNVDPIAYRCGYDDYVNSVLSDADYELESYGITEVNGVKFKIDEDDEEEE